MRAIYMIYSDLHGYIRLVNKLEASVVARGVNIEQRFTIYMMLGKPSCIHAKFRLCASLPIPRGCGIGSVGSVGSVGRGSGRAAPPATAAPGLTSATGVRTARRPGDGAGARSTVSRPRSSGGPLPPGVVRNHIAINSGVNRRSAAQKSPAIPGLPKWERSSTGNAGTLSQGPAAARSFLLCEIRKWKVVIS